MKVSSRAAILQPGVAQKPNGGLAHFQTGAPNKPIYQIEEAFEQSIRIESNDVNRYHYATYLIRQDEYERALQQIEQASLCEGVIQSTFRSLKGLVLMRIGRVAEAIVELDEVWAKRSKDIPVKVGLTQGTQLAEAYRRQSEQMSLLGKHPEALTSCCKAARVIDEAIGDYGYDSTLVGTAVNILACVVGFIATKGIDVNVLVEQTCKWDSSAEFRGHVMSSNQTLDYFRRYPDLMKFFPNIAKELLTRGYGKRQRGTIQFIVQEGKYGFIVCSDLGRVHFGLSSLVDSSTWSTLKANDVVVFGVMLPRDTSRLPHAVNLELATEAKPQSQ